MGLLQKLKSALGLNGTESSESGRSGDVDVTVEREPSTADEDAVKGTETASSGTTAEPEDSDPSASTEAETPSADEFETLAGESGDGEPDEAGETEADADAETATEDAETDTAKAEGEADADADAADAEAVEGSTDPVTELNGIGPAYGDRLAGAGIETVGELAAADAAAVADQIELGESRVAGWIEQANDY